METRIMFFVVMLVCVWLIVSERGRKIINKTAELIVGNFSIGGILTQIDKKVENLDTNTTVSNNSYDYQYADKLNRTIAQQKMTRAEFKKLPKEVQVSYIESWTQFGVKPKFKGE
jgi:hypothetical protein